MQAIYEAIPMLLTAVSWGVRGRGAGGRERKREAVNEREGKARN